MKRLRQFSQIHKTESAVRRHISYFILGLLTLFLITAVVPVAAQHSPSASIEPHTTHASTQLEQGKTLYEAGRIADAVTVWQQAAQDYEAKGDRINQSFSLNYLSLAYQDLGQWQNAQKAISQSLELIPPNESFILAQALNTQGSLQLALGNAEAALATWKQAEQAYKAAEDEVGVIGTQINQSQALQTLGLYRWAKTNLEQVNQKLQNKPDSLLKAAGLRSLGVALQVVGDLQQSQEVLEQSLAIQERLDSAGDTSATLFSLGNTRRALQDYQKATGDYQKAAEKATNPLSQLEVQLNQLSLLVQTEQWQAAQALLPTIQTNLTQLAPSRSAVYAQVNLAESLIKLSAFRGNVERSPNPLPSSTATDIAQLLAKAVQQARMLKDSRAESYAVGELAHLYEYTQNFPEAQKLTQDALSLAQAINASDITYRWQWQLGRIHKQQGELKGGLNQPHMVEALAAYSEAVKALQSLRSDLVAINPDVQFSFRESVEPIYRELVELLLQSLPERDQVSRQENLKQARQVIESLQLAELDNFFQEACLNTKPEQIDRLDPTAAVIYPIILPDSFAVILSLPGQPLSYYQTQLRQSEVEGILEQFLQSLNRSVSNKQRLRFSQQVYDWLIRPAEAQLAESGVKTLVFVLDGSLRNLPMAALYDGKQYLVEKYSIALSQGLQLLEPRSALRSSTSLSLVRNRLTALTGGLTEARQGFAALPGVKSELKQIASEVRSEVLLNQEFTQKRLEKKISSLPFPVIHLATHAQFSSKAEDTFLLTWDGRIKVKDFDELLQSRQRQNQNPIELLVLSACQTAAGDRRATLGLAGLAVRSGARSTLATLWSVSDESTAEFMAEFYRELFQTQVSKAEAVRQSQLMLLRNAKYEHPYYWAPFVLVGNWL